MALLLRYRYCTGSIALKVLLHLSIAMHCSTVFNLKRAGVVGPDIVGHILPSFDEKSPYMSHQRHIEDKCDLYYLALLHYQLNCIRILALS